MKKKLLIIGVAVLVVALLIFLAVNLLPWIAIIFGEPAEFFPKEGVWYCEELQLSLGMETNADSFLIVDGEKILCAAVYNDGSPFLYVDSQDVDTSRFLLGETVFKGEFVSLTETGLVLQDTQTKQNYVFVKQP